MKRKSVLDAYALLAYLEGEAGHEKIKVLLSSEGPEILMNAVNLGEVFYILSRARGSKAAEYFLEVILPGLPITVVENSREDVIEAARLKARHALSYADCFAAATAIRERAALVTGDPEFRKLGEALEIDWVG